MERRDVELGPLRLIAYGHWGRPVLAFPSELGRRWDWEDRGMVSALAPLIDGGRIKLYCVDAVDEYTWRADDVPLEERARRHGEYEAWVNAVVAPWVHAETDGGEIVVTGASFGAYHAANFTLRRADLFPLAICLSGMYDLGRIGWGERGNATYFNNPVDYVPHMHGDHLNWIRSRVYVVLVCGQGAWEDDSASGSLSATKQFAAVLADKGIPHELDLWGYDVAHDWPWWRKQLAHHLPRFV